MPEQLAMTLPAPATEPRYRLGGDNGPIVEHIGPSDWRSCEQWRVVRRGIWRSAAWQVGTTINAPWSEAREES